MGSRVVATDQLKKLRITKEWDQRSMAEALSIMLNKDISYSLYQKIEQGKRSIDIKDAIAISKMFNSSIKELWQKQSV